MESSGSMIGERIDISKHVVNNILNTLAPHDYINVITFNDDPQYLVHCMKDLVEASPDNIHQFKMALIVSICYIFFLSNFQNIILIYLGVG